MFFKRKKPAAASSAPPLDFAEVEARYRLIIENTNELIAVTDLFSRYVYLSPSHKRILGYEPADLLGKSGLAFIHPDDRKLLVPLLRKYISARGKRLFTGKDSDISETFEYRFKDKNGNWRNMVSTGNIKGNDLFFITRDVTKRKQAERQLKESEQKLRMIIENMDHVIFQIDVAGRIQYISPNLRDMYGYTPEELIGRNVSAVMPGREMSKAFSVIAKLFTGKPVKNLEIDLQDKSGNPIPTEINITPFQKGKSIAFAQGVIRNVSERKLAQRELEKHQEQLEELVRLRTKQLEAAKQKLEQELEERTGLAAQLKSSEERFRVLFESAPDAYYMNDLTGTFVDGNRKAEELAGSPRRDLVGSSFLKLNLIGKEDIVKAAALLAKNMMGRPTGPDEFTLHRKDGSAVPVEICTVPVVIDKKKLVLGIARDISIRKQAEAELEKAKDDAEAANKAKSLFLANMSHEIRTPLTAVIGFARMLSDTPLSEIQRDYADTICSSGDLLLGIISNILDVAKIEAGEVRLESIDFDLEYLLSGLLRIARQRVAGKDVGLRFEYPADAPRSFVGDPTRVRQIFLNLLNNAAKFTDHGSITLAVACESITDSRMEGKAERRLVRISVVDTGTGIPEAVQREIFDPFVQADASTTRKYGGTGLGLAIVRALVEKMGGVITVNSEVGKGSEFTVTLVLDEGKKAERTSCANTGEGALAGKRMLIVDADPPAREITARLCSETGMVVVAAVGSATEALAALQSCDPAPDAIVYQCERRDLPAADFASQVRALHAVKGTRLFALTGDAEPGSARAYADLGFDAYCSKPVSRSDFENIMRMLFGQGPAREENLVTRHSAAEQKGVGAAVLVAEDNPVNRKLLSVMLAKLGCAVSFAVNGTEAVDKACSRHFDMVFMDVQMPEMGGVDATREIRRRLGQRIPIIALTAHALSEDREVCLAAGMNDYLVKPISEVALREKLVVYGKR